MKIGIDARFYRQETGGIGRYTRGLLTELAKTDKKNQYTVFITPKDQPEYNIKAENFTLKIIDIIHYTLDEQNKFLKILNKEKFDLVHFLNFNHPIFYRRPFITTIHDLTMLLYPVGRQQRSLIRRIAFRAVINSAAKRSKAIIAVSRETRNDCLKYLNANPDKIKVIYEAVDSSYARKIRSTKSEARNKSKCLKFKKFKIFENSNFENCFEFRNSNFGFNIQKPYLLFVSQWRPHKGLPQLIEAFELLKKKYKSNVQLVIIGKPNPDFPKIPQAISDSQYAKDLIAPGFVSEEELNYLYKNATLFVFPSLYEGFGLPPLEAMAYGTPVLSSNLSCMPEVLGNAAEYFDPDNIENLAQKINHILVDSKLRGKMIRAGLEQVKKFSWQKMAQETLEVYKEVLR